MNTVRRALLVVVPLLLLGVAGAAIALAPRVSWSPAELVTDSIAPGEQATYAVVLKNTGWLPIPVGQQLQIVAEGDIAPYITIKQPAFPKGAFRRGQEVSFDVTVAVPTDAPVGVSQGSLVLARVLPNGKVKEVWRAEGLPVSVEVVAIEFATEILGQTGILVSYPSTWESEYGNDDGDTLILYGAQPRPDQGEHYCIPMDDPECDLINETGGEGFSPPSVIIHLVKDTTIDEYALEEHVRLYSEKHNITVDGRNAILFDDRSSPVPHRPDVITAVDVSPSVLVISSEYSSFEDYMQILESLDIQ